jgi:hypothetical protein
MLLLLFSTIDRHDIVEMEGCNRELNKGCIAVHNARSDSALASKFNIGESEHTLRELGVRAPSKEDSGCSLWPGGYREESKVTKVSDQKTVVMFCISEFSHTKNRVYSQNSLNYIYKAPS